VRCNWLWTPVLFFLFLCVSSCAGELKNPKQYEIYCEYSRTGKCPDDSGAAGTVDSAVPAGSGGGGGVVAAAGVSGSTAGGGDSAASGGAGGSTLNTEVDACVAEVLTSSCATTGCHAASPAINTNLEPDSGLVGRLVGQQVAAGKLCVGETLIATDGSDSLLVKKLSATPGCGAQMPTVGTLTQTQIDCITSWVDSFSGG